MTMWEWADRHSFFLFILVFMFLGTIGECLRIVYRRKDEE